LLGGELLYCPRITQVISELNIHPIITTNGHRLRDKSFRENLDYQKIKAMNISLPHYDHAKRIEIMRCQGLSNPDLEEIVKNIPLQVRINALLINGYIDSLDEVHKMIEFAKYHGAHSIKFGEITGNNESSHDFVSDEVMRYNVEHYCKIPISEMYKKCHEIGGTHYYDNISGIDVYFNSAPDFALSGGRDKNGKYYHAVLFNDGMQGTRYHPKLPVCHAYIVSENLTTRFFTNPITFSKFDENRDNLFELLGELVDKDCTFIPRPHDIVLATVYQPHESQIAQEDISRRTFMRVEYSLKKFDRKDNSKNHLLDTG